MGFETVRSVPGTRYRASCGRDSVIAEDLTTPLKKIWSRHRTEKGVENVGLLGVEDTFVVEKAARALQAAADIIVVLIKTFAEK